MVRLQTFLYRTFYRFQNIAFVYILLLAITCPYQDIRWAGAISLGGAFLTNRLLHIHKSRIGKWLDRVTVKGDRIFLGAQIISLLTMLLFAWFLRVENSWDYGQIIDSAYSWVNNGTIHNLAYYARYSNNQLILLILSLLFEIIRVFSPNASIELCKAVSVVVNCLVIQGAIFFTYSTAKYCFSKKQAFITGMLSLLCSPLYLYSSIMYTDTLGLLPLSLTLYFYVRFLKEDRLKRWLFALESVFWGVLGYYLKATIGIVLIAIVIDFVLRNFKESFVKMRHNIGLFAIIFGLTFFAENILITNILQNFTGITEQLYEENRFPPYHWIMMALNKTGGYNQEDVEFSKSFSTIEERKAAEITEIGQRLSERGVSGTLSHIFYTKWRRTWTYSTCAADDYICRKPINENILHQFFTADGKFYLIYILYAHTFWLLLLFNICKSAKQKKFEKTFVFHLSLFGLLAFLSFWECNPRYLVVFLPVLILLEADGVTAIYSEDIGGIVPYV